MKELFFKKTFFKEKKVRAPCKQRLHLFSSSSEGGEKEALPESRETFEAAADQTSWTSQSYYELVSSSASICLLINRWS